MAVVIVTITIIITSCTFIRPLLLMNKFTLFSLSDTLSFGEAVVLFREALLNGSLFVGDSSYFFPRNSPLLIEEKLTVQLCLITFLVQSAVLLASISPTFCPPFFVQSSNFTNICAKIVLRKLDYKFCAVCHILALFCQMLSAQ